MSSSSLSSSSLTSTAETLSTTATERGIWPEDEHDRFLIGLQMFPKGPWRKIAELVDTRSARQVQTHAQKYYEKIERRVRGLLKIAQCATEDIRETFNTTDLPGTIRNGKSEELLDSKQDEVLQCLQWCEGNLLKCDDSTMWNSGAINTSDRDPLPDGDDCCLAYLIQILDSSDTTKDEYL